MLKKNDEKLVSQYLKGDEKSLEILIKQYLKPIYSFVYRYLGSTSDAEDITQEVFLRTWRNLRKFDQQKSFKTWIFTIAKNTAIDFLKKKKAIPLSYFENGNGENMIIKTLADPSPLPNELLEQKGMVEILIKALEKLSPKYRLVLLLRYSDHLIFREIAESLGEPIHTVKSRYYRALILLKKLLN